MADHDLEVGVVIDLNVSGCGCTGGFESDGGVRGDVCIEATPIPRCLPLSSNREKTCSKGP